MPKTISKEQQIHLDLIRLASFNDFDGDLVVRDLMAHPDLWKACLMTRSYGPGFLITLRDLKVALNVDTLYILVDPSKLTELKTLSERWGADEIVIHSGREASDLLGSYPSPEDVLELWWD